MSDTARKWLVAAAGSLLAFGVLTMLVSYRALDGVDHFVRGIVFHPGGPSPFRSFMEAASLWGGQRGQVLLVGVGSTFFWQQQRRRWALSLPLIMAGVGALQLIAKWGMNRPRPNLDPWGFPSAHVFSLVVLLGCIGYVIGTSAFRKRWRWLGVSLCGLIVCFVAFSRMYLDAHWLSDILGGFSIGLAYLLAVIWAHARHPARLGRDATPAPALCTSSAGTGVSGTPSARVA